MPETEWALRAEQRLAHLGSTDQLLGTEARHVYQVPHIEGDPGLDGGISVGKPVEENCDQLAARFVKHLEEFPQAAKLPRASRDEVALECADVLLFLLRLCDKLDIDLTAVAQKKLRLNAKKYPVGKSRGNAIKYTKL
jgi:hypothetical protein